MAAEFIPALPGHFIDHQGGQRPPVSYSARVAVRVADAAIARALYRAEADALRPWVKRDAPFCTGKHAAMYNAMPGLPLWPRIAPPYVDPRRNA